MIYYCTAYKISILTFDAVLSLSLFVELQQQQQQQRKINSQIEMKCTQFW